MRRMRDFIVHFSMFAVPTIAAALLIHWGIKKYYLSGSPYGNVAGANHSTEKTKTDANRDLASSAAGAPAGAMTADKIDAELKAEMAAESALEAEAAKKQRPGANCASVELPGGGPTLMTFSDADWELVLTQFRQSKGALAAWLKSHQKELPENTFAFMEKQLDAVKLPRPPTNGEPDLTYRGITVYGHDDSDDPSVSIGGGFLNLVKANPVRAGFELTRAVAQAWAPCELAKAKVDGPWTSLLTCLDVKEAKACSDGSYSEGGWAVSSTLAAMASPPGCRLPAFTEKKANQCLKNIPLPLPLTAKKAPLDLRPSDLWKEARR